MNYMRNVRQIGHSEGAAYSIKSTILLFDLGGPSFRPDLPSGRAPRAAAVRDAAARRHRRSRRKASLTERARC
jgi:hypothetical protein